MMILLGVRATMVSARLKPAKNHPTMATVMSLPPALPLTRMMLSMGWVSF